MRFPSKLQMEAGNCCEPPVGTNFHGVVEDMLKSQIDTFVTAKATPEEAIVSGVLFKRSKNGNLVRAGVVQQGFVFDDIAKSSFLLTILRYRLPQQSGKTKLCRQYTSTGTRALSRPVDAVFPMLAVVSK